LPSPPSGGQGDLATIEDDEAVGDVIDVMDIVAMKRIERPLARTARTKRKTFSVSVSEKRRGRLVEDDEVALL